jgi:hypothetical protein
MRRQGSVCPDHRLLPPVNLRPLPMNKRYMLIRNTFLPSPNTPYFKRVLVPQYLLTVELGMFITPKHQTNALKICVLSLNVSKHY